MDNLPMCSCAEFYDSHPPDCPVRRRIEELERLATQRGARMQIMREWMEETSMNDPDILDDWVSEAFFAAHPEAADWFDADGVPVSEK